MNKIRNSVLGASIVLASVFGFAGVASATPTPSEQVTTMATDAAGDLTPIILGVGGALVAVAVIRFGVRWVLSSVGRGGKA